jgi:hypothetical protein
MSLWSTIKKAVKRVWRIIKTFARIAVRGLTITLPMLFKLWDLFFGFLGWPPKRMKVHIAVLRNQNGPVLQNLNELMPSIELLKRVYKDYGNITVNPYSSGNKNEIDNWAQVLPDIAPAKALRTRSCGPWESTKDLFGEAGEYFSANLAGWVSGIPISLSFPITVFVVEDIPGYFGCTYLFVSDYVLVTVDGLPKEISTIAHEIGHRCNIPFESSDPTNLMFSSSAKANQPPYRLSGWQRNLVRASRHVTYLF